VRPAPTHDHILRFCAKCDPGELRLRYCFGTLALNFFVSLCATRFAFRRSNVAARQLLFASIVYLPAMFVLMMPSKMMITVPMLAVATMQRSDSDPHDTMSMPIEVDPHWMIMWPFDPKTTGLPSAHKATGAYIMWAGSPYAHLHLMGRPEGVKSRIWVAPVRNVALPYPFRYRLSSNRGEIPDGIRIYTHFRPMKRVSSIGTF
jgi:hypothetical protein